jgi:alcohol dehydrogenase class IV
VAEDAGPWLVELAQDLAIPTLRAYGIAPSDYPDICAKAAVSSSMKANPIPLLETELMEILERSG